jgi:hypothetical protein
MRFSAGGARLDQHHRAPAGLQVMHRPFFEQATFRYQTG